MIRSAFWLMLQVITARGDSTRHALLIAEDARAATPAQLALLLNTTRDADPSLRALALRALGRLERPDLVDGLAPSLQDPDPAVRRAGADAIAQAAWRQSSPEAFQTLATRLTSEPDPAVAAALLAALGRLRPPDSGIEPQENLLGQWIDRPGPTREGALRGLVDLYRRAGRRTPPRASLVETLRRVAQQSIRPRERLFALAALVGTRSVDGPTLSAALIDDVAEIRRLGAGELRASGDPPDRLLVATAIGDQEVRVRYEGVAAYGRHFQSIDGCEPLFEAMEDPSVHLQLLAIDLLGAGCPDSVSLIPRLVAVTKEAPGADTWHRPAHALVSLSQVSPQAARDELGRFTNHSISWIRRSAARAATVLQEDAILIRLSRDVDPNVAVDALQGLARLRGHRADTLAIASLTRDDYQLVLTAAGLLKESPMGETVARAAIDAFRRITLERKETSRDPRMALLDRIEEFGSPTIAGDLVFARNDFDPLVAGRVRHLLDSWHWTGAEGDSPLTELPVPLPVPTPEASRAMVGAVLLMRDGRRMTVELFPDLAPLNVSRFVAMARSGWFDGLTWHRVVPNFVIQGGSPHANEYAGGDAFARDEVGGHHWRGTIGISTRGHDTGDGQLFINLVDNLRLDYAYTVIGQITSGWEVLDAVQEGAVIETIRVLGVP